MNLNRHTSTAKSEDAGLKQTFEADLAVDGLHAAMLVQKQFALGEEVVVSAQPNDPKGPVIARGAVAGYGFAANVQDLNVNRVDPVVMVRLDEKSGHFSPGETYYHSLVPFAPQYIQKAENCVAETSPVVDVRPMGLRRAVTPGVVAPVPKRAQRLLEDTKIHFKHATQGFDYGVLELPAGLRVTVLQGGSSLRYVLDEFPESVFPRNSGCRHDAEHYGVEIPLSLVGADPEARRIREHLRVGHSLPVVGASSVDLEQRAIADHAAMVGTVVEAVFIDGYADKDGCEDHLSIRSEGKPFKLLVVETPRQDICRWADEGHLDPYWNVVLAERHPDAAFAGELRNLWIYGPSYAKISAGKPVEAQVQNAVTPEVRYGNGLVFLTDGGGCGLGTVMKDDFAALGLLDDQGNSWTTEQLNLLSAGTVYPEGGIDNPTVQDEMDRFGLEISMGDSAIFAGKRWAAPTLYVDCASGSQEAFAVANRYANLLAEKAGAIGGLVVKPRLAPTGYYLVTTLIPFEWAEACGDRERYAEKFRKTMGLVR